MGKLTVTYLGDEYTIDHFYNSLMFQRIMDSDFSGVEKQILLVISRKTIHFNKWNDKISIYQLSKLADVGDRKTRTVIRQLEEKGVIEVIRSKGGYGAGNPERWHTFSLSYYLVELVLREWLKIKENNNFHV